MIVSFPTALYESILPKSDDDTNNVTFTISSEDPPRTSTTAFELFRGEELRKLPTRVFNDRERRTTFGDFVFSLSSGSQISTEDGKKSFEVGELLEFGVVEETESISSTEVPDIIDMQQNTNKLDLIGLGLSEEQATLLIQSSEDRFDELVKSIISVQTGIKNVSAMIDSNQKQINEVRKAKDAAVVVLGSITDNPILVILEQKEQDLLLERNELINSLNQNNVEVKQLFNDLLRVREMVR